MTTRFLVEQTFIAVLIDKSREEESDRNDVLVWITTIGLKK